MSDASRRDALKFGVLAGLAGLLDLRPGPAEAAPIPVDAPPTTKEIQAAFDELQFRLTRAEHSVGQAEQAFGKLPRIAAAHYSAKTCPPDMQLTVLGDRGRFRVQCSSPLTAFDGITLAGPEPGRSGESEGWWRLICDVRQKPEVRGLLSRWDSCFGAIHLGSHERTLWSLSGHRATTIEDEDTDSPLVILEGVGKIFVGGDLGGLQE